MYSFPIFLKKMRDASGLTQSELAAVLGVSTILISMLETGQKTISKNFINKLAEKLEVHPASISPFAFDSDLKPGKLSPIERSLIEAGERLQVYLITKKAKKLATYERKKEIPKNRYKE